MMLMADPQPTDAFAWTQEPWGRALVCRRLTAPHLFTSRDLMLRDDEREWTSVAASLGVTRERLLLVRQVHGVNVAIARRGHADRWPRPTADIILSDDPSVAIGVRVADCAPILLHDPVLHIAGAVHAGWRGAAAGAATAAVHAMRREFKSRASDLVAAIGPCLGQCCGEVGPEVVEAFRAGGADAAQIDAWFTRGQGDRSFLDLESANRDQLVRAGLNPSTIFTSGICTKTHHDRLHSYRGDRDRAGRLLGAIRAVDSGHR
jgi:purine-nucleoside/S-methyl-5'-thioadenosine phosphorylase / adenosine deaminase